ncbi:amino acid permease [bacterium]|nr:amino acid permease [bacterium]
MGLERKLGLIDIFCIASGAMISSGLFILPGIAFATSGPSVILAYIIASLLVVPAVFSKSELSSAMPKAAGDYFILDRSFGPAAGALGGISAWFSLSFKSAFALIGMSAFAYLLAPNLTEWQFKFIAIGLCVLFSVINTVSVKHAGKLQIGLVLVLLGLLAAYIFWGFHTVDVSRYSPFMPFGFGSVLTTTGLVFIAYGGITKIASLAEETKDPGRNIPLGMLLALIIISIFYGLTVIVTVGVLPAETLRTSLIPISQSAGTFAGTFGVAVMAIAAILAFVSTANAGIMAASRTPMAMSQDGHIPSFFSNLHPKYGTPYKSIIFTAAFMIAVILFLNLTTLVKVASTFKILLFMSANLSVIVMRESRIINYKPVFKSPLYPWIQILGIAGYALLLVKIGWIPLAIAGGFFGVSLLWYWFYSKIKVQRESALVYFIQRLTSRKLTENVLTGELRDILRERDDLIEDRFDRLIQDCDLIDLEGPLEACDFFRIVAQTINQKLGMEDRVLIKLLIDREQESSTVISPGLAIPHVIVEGEGNFNILVARCKKGINFPGQEVPVKVVFGLFGSHDQRNFHLKSLAAIAQIIQDKDFEKNWHNAKTCNELRDIILLAERKRHRCYNGR